ncbi:hypothetical protein HGM15179_016728 [Zosterops borbonicus]|uniref:Uncharacterized protein n=1 Tax=Zosterops borbonicus TaxID=364589 RepID=A0A8K1G2I5_9PASS|nr:hypothetical protein HGM15179_016728 [Zosterops borbonicus]
MDISEGGCDHAENLQWSRLQAGYVALWREEPMLKKVCWKTLRGAHAGAGLLAELVDPMVEPYWSSLFRQGCILWKEPMLEQFMMNCSV